MQPSFQLNAIVKGHEQNPPGSGCGCGACRERGDLAAQQRVGNAVAQRKQQLLSSLAPSPSDVCHQRLHA